MVKYIVGLRQEKKSKSLIVEDENALVAALRAQHEYPNATITFVRKSNRRGDHRHPHPALAQRSKDAR